MPRIVSDRTAAALAIASRSSSPPGTVAARREAWRGWSWFDRTTVGQRSGPNARSRRRIADANAVADQGRVRSSQSKTRCRSVVRAAAPSVVPTNISPTVIRPGAASTTRPEPRQQLGQVRLVDVVEVDLAVPRRRAAPGRIGRQVGMLEVDVEDVEAEAVDAPGDPRPDHVELRVLDGRLPPVEVRLLREEGVVVELAAPRLVRPGRAAEPRHPVVRRQRAARPIDRRPDRATGTSRRARRSVTRRSPRTTDARRWCG